MTAGIIEHTEFAHTVDPHIETVHITCPLDLITDGYCTQEFRP